MRRFLAGALLTLGCTILGFAVAMIVATLFVYPGPSNLDNGLARISMAFSGGLLGLAAGLGMAFAMQQGQALRAGLIALLLGLVAIGAFVATRPQRNATQAE